MARKPDTIPNNIIQLRIPYLGGIAVRRDAARMVSGRFQRGRPYVSWHLRIGSFQRGGWYPKVSARAYPEPHRAKPEAALRILQANT